MSPGIAAVRPAVRRFPRVSGDEPIEWRAEDALALFSPRERG